jgi:hypothetical protein
MAPVNPSVQDELAPSPEGVNYEKFTTQPNSPATAEQQAAHKGWWTKRRIGAVVVLGTSEALRAGQTMQLG